MLRLDVGSGVVTAGLIAAALAWLWPEPRPVSGPPAQVVPLNNPLLLTAPADTTLGREERIIACTSPAVQQAWLASGRPPIWLLSEHTALGTWVGPYYFELAPGVPVPPGAPVEPGRRLVLTAAVLDIGCPYERAPWWGQPVPWSGRPVPLPTLATATSRLSRA